MTPDSSSGDPGSIPGRKRDLRMTSEQGHEASSCKDRRIMKSTAHDSIPGIRDRSRSLPGRRRYPTRSIKHTKKRLWELPLTVLQVVFVLSNYVTFFTLQEIASCNNTPDNQIVF